MYVYVYRRYDVPSPLQAATKQSYSSRWWRNQVLFSSAVDISCLEPNTVNRGVRHLRAKLYRRGVSVWSGMLGWSIGEAGADMEILNGDGDVVDFTHWATKYALSLASQQ